MRAEPVSRYVFHLEKAESAPLAAGLFAPISWLKHSSIVQDNRQSQIAAYSNPGNLKTVSDIDRETLAHRPEPDVRYIFAEVSLGMAIVLIALALLVKRIHQRRSRLA